MLGSLLNAVCNCLLHLIANTAWGVLVGWACLQLHYVASLQPRLFGWAQMHWGIDNVVHFKPSWKPFEVRKFFSKLNFFYMHERCDIWYHKEAFVVSSSLLLVCKAWRVVTLKCDKWREGRHFALCLILNRTTLYALCHNDFNFCNEATSSGWLRVASMVWWL